MSVQRSPPGSQQELNTPNISVHYNSDSALNVQNKSDTDEIYFNTTKRQKRTFGDLSLQPMSSMSEIKAMFSEFKEQHDHKYESINTALTTIMTQNLEIQKSVETLTCQHEHLLTKINNLEQENSTYKKRLSYLETKLDLLEKSSYSTTIEIRNLPKQIQETKTYFTDTIKTLGSTLGLETPIQNSEIRNIFRSKSEAIVVDFTTTLRKESLISKFRQYNKTRRESKEAPLNSQQIKIPGASHTIYISEYLTSKARRIFYMARESVKNKKLAAAWTSYGKVFAKKDEGSTPVRIDEESDLCKLTL